MTKIQQILELRSSAVRNDYNMWKEKRQTSKRHHEKWTNKIRYYIYIEHVVCFSTNCVRMLGSHHYAVVAWEKGIPHWKLCSHLPPPPVKEIDCRNQPLLAISFNFTTSMPPTKMFWWCHSYFEVFLERTAISNNSIGCTSNCMQMQHRYRTT